jgi:hypothetical protein
MMTEWHCPVCKLTREAVQRGEAQRARQVERHPRCGHVMFWWSSTQEDSDE